MQRLLHLHCATLGVLLVLGEVRFHLPDGPFAFACPLRLEAELEGELPERDAGREFQALRDVEQLRFHVVELHRRRAGAGAPEQELRGRLLRVLLVEDGRRRSGAREVHEVCVGRRFLAVWTGGASGKVFVRAFCRFLSEQEEKMGFRSDGRR
jgi:hypothetical protein